MDGNRIEQVQKLNAEIENFRDCYSGNELWGCTESFVAPEKLIEFLIEHPHFQVIANNIANLDN